MLVEGQILGGAAQGLGGALFEDFSYDEIGQPQVTSFMDYLMPTAADMPEIEILLSEDAPSPLNPLGVKDAGEGGTNACGAVIAAAIDDALGFHGIIQLLRASKEDGLALKLFVLAQEILHCAESIHVRHAVSVSNSHPALPGYRSRNWFGFRYN